MKLLLWDIDGTLVNVRRFGARALNEAFKTVYGIDSALPARSMAGKTDLQILKEFLEAGDLVYRDLAAERRKILPVYRRLLDGLLREARGKAAVLPADRTPFVYPGVRELLDRLRRTKGVVNGLLTGNFRCTAKLKLEYFSLWRYFRLGAFGGESAVREDLVKIALDECWRLFRCRPRGRDVCVIGDTPNDVAITKPCGIRSVAVATGIYSAADLAVCGPDFLLKDLTEFPAGEILAD